MRNGRSAELSKRTASKTVMVIDDEQVVRDVLCDFLEAKGFRTLPCKDGKSAVSMAARDKPDLVLLDIKMPGIDGIRTCHRLKELIHLKEILHPSPGTGIIMLTGYATPENVDKAIDSGAIDIVAKPFDLRDIFRRINTWFEVRDIKNETERVRSYSEKINRHLSIGQVR